MLRFERRGADVNAAARSHLNCEARRGEMKSFLHKAPRGEIERCLRDCRVSNVRTTPTGAELRIFAPKPPLPGAVAEEATLEDVFLHYFGEKGDGEDAAL